MTIEQQKIIKRICIAILILSVLYIACKGQEKEDRDAPEYWKESRENDKNEHFVNEKDNFTNRVR